MIHRADAAQIHRWMPQQVQGVRPSLTTLTGAGRGRTGTGHAGRRLPREDWSYTQGQPVQRHEDGKDHDRPAPDADRRGSGVQYHRHPDHGGRRQACRHRHSADTGATPRQIMAIFMVQGSIIGFSGTVIGVILGVLGALNVSDLVTWLERLSDSTSSAPTFISSVRCLRNCVWMTWCWYRWRRYPELSPRSTRLARRADPACRGPCATNDRLRQRRPLSPPPAAANPPAPVGLGEYITEHRQHQPADQGAQVQRLPVVLQHVAYPGQAQFCRHAGGRSVQQPGADLVVAIEDRRHGQRVGQPDQPHRDRQIGSEGRAQTAAASICIGIGIMAQNQPIAIARYRMSIEMPEIGIVNQRAEKTQDLLVLMRSACGM